MLLLSILEKFFLQDGAVSGRNEKDSRIFHNNLLETQIHQQYSNGDVNHHIAEHHWQTKHEIDWDFATYNTFFRLLSTSYFRKLVY